MQGFTLRPKIVPSSLLRMTSQTLAQALQTMFSYQQAWTIYTKTCASLAIGSPIYITRISEPKTNKSDHETNCSHLQAEQPNLAQDYVKLRHEA